MLTKMNDFSMKHFINKNTLGFRDKMLLLASFVGLGLQAKKAVAVAAAAVAAAVCRLWRPLIT